MLQLLESLAEVGVGVGLLRGHGLYPRFGDGSDLDLSLAARDLPAFESHLAQACRETRVRMWRRDDYGHAIQFHLAGEAQDGPPDHLSLDVHTAETCYGVPFLAGKRLVATENDSRGLPIAPTEASAVTNFLGPYLSAGFTSALFQSRLAAVLTRECETHRDAGPAQKLLGECLGAKRAAAVSKAISEGDAESLAGLARGTRRSLLLRCFRRRPLQSSLGLARFFWSVRIRPHLRPRGLCLAFVGTDGSGKSTLLEAVREDLRMAFRGQAGARIKLRPGLLPQLDRIVHLGRSTYGPEDCKRPHRAKPSGALLSGLRASWYALDYFLGWPLRITPLRRRHGLVIFDRHYLDFLVDPERARIRRGGRLIRALARLIPKPDAFVVCLADPAKVHARKPELTAAECTRQMEAYTQLAQSWPNCHAVQTDGALEDSVAAVRQIALREVA